MSYIMFKHFNESNLKCLYSSSIKSFMILTIQKLVIEKVHTVYMYISSGVVSTA